MAIRILDQVLEKSSIGLRRILVSPLRCERRSESACLGVFAEESDDVVVIDQWSVHEDYQYLSSQPDQTSSIVSIILGGVRSSGM